MKKVNIFFLLLAWGLNMYADAVAEKLLQDNRKSKLLLEEQLRKEADLRGENKSLILERKNLELTIHQMESVLANIKDPAVPAIYTAETVKPAGKTTVLEKKLRNIAEFKSNELNPDYAAITSAPDGADALRIKASDLIKQKKTVLEIWLPVEKLVGKKVICSVKVKGENISPVKVHYLGGKFMLMIKRSNNKTDWPDASIGTGTFDWKEVNFSTNIPFDASGCLLVLGLQGVTGTIYFRDLKVEAVDDE
jgi:hypothetical protein